MIKSISAWAFNPARPAQEIFQVAKNNGFDGVELSIGEEGFPLAYQVTAASTPDECKHLVAQANDAGVKLVSMANGLTWSYPITVSDALTRQKGIEVIGASLKVAQWLGVETVLVVPGGVGADFIPGFPVTPYDTAHRNLLSSMEVLAGMAQEAGVDIGLENVWNKFLLSPLEFRQTIDAIGSPRIGCYFDVGNALLCGYPEHWIALLGKRVKRVHFKDFKRVVGTMDGFCDLLDGDVDYSAVMRSLRDIEYTGPVTAEFFNCENDLPKISSAMDKILAM